MIRHVEVASLTQTLRFRPPDRSHGTKQRRDVLAALPQRFSENRDKAQLRIALECPPRGEPTKMGYGNLRRRIRRDQLLEARLDIGSMRKGQVGKSCAT